MASWLASILVSFGGTFVSNALTGHSVLAPLGNYRDLLTATCVWYCLNYLPLDAGYRLCRWLPVRLVVCCLKEVQRARKVQNGVLAAHALLPDSHIAVVLLGMLRGNSSPVMLVAARTAMGRFVPPVFGSCTLTTKVCTAAAAAFALCRFGFEPAVDNEELLFVGVVLLFVLLRVSSLLAGLGDPLLMLELPLCSLLFGGVAEAVGRLAGDEEKAKKPKPSAEDSSEATQRPADASGPAKAGAAKKRR